MLRALTASWGNPRRTIDLCARDADLATVSFDPRDVVVFAVPSYGGRVPRAVAERMAALKGNGAACVLLCVYGNRAFDDTLAEMEDIAVAAGFRPAAAVAAIAEHSIVRRFAAGRPDAQDADELEAMGRRIRERVEEPGTENRSFPEIVPTGSQARSRSFPRPRKAASNAEPALRAARWERLTPQIPPEQIKTRALPACAASPFVLRM